jgi:hypothetical protein
MKRHRASYSMVWGVIWFSVAVLIVCAAMVVVWVVTDGG